MIPRTSLRTTHGASSIATSVARSTSLAVAGFTLVAASAVACGGRLEPVSQGAPRLRVERTLLDGGASWITGLYDTQLGQACTPTKLSDGALRCVPWPRIGNARSVYADAACTAPAQIAQRDATVRWKVVAYGSPSCGDDGARVYSAGRTLAVAYELSGAGCGAAGAPPAGAEWVEQGPEVPPSTFAALHEEPVTTSVAVTRSRLLDDDGQDLGPASRAPFVAAYGQCFAGLAEDGVRRCVPALVAYVPAAAFLDDSCTVGAALGMCAGPSGPRWAVVPLGANDPAAPLRWRVHEIDAYGELAPVHSRDSSGACTASGVQARMAPLGAPRPATDFVAMPDLVDEGRGRIRVRSLYGAQVSLYDATLDVTCVLGDDGAGARRCLPPPSHDGGFFADAGCAQPAFSSQVFDAAPRYTTARTIDGALRGAFEVTGVTQTAFERVNGACVPLAAGSSEALAPASPASFLIVGAAVPWSTFAAVP